MEGEFTAKFDPKSILGPSKSNKLDEVTANFLSNSDDEDDEKDEDKDSEMLDDYCNAKKEYLDAPNDQIVAKRAWTDNSWWGACQVQGWAKEMEDTYICDQIKLPDEDGIGMVYGLFDGHNGTEVSGFIKDNFTRLFVSLDEFKAKDYKNALNLAFLVLDVELKKEEYSLNSGAAANVVFVTAT